MKMKILGVEPKSGVDRKTGEAYSSVTLHLSGKNGRVYGEKCESISVYSNSPLFQVIAPFASVPQNLVGCEILVDYNSRGYLENIEIVNSKSDK